MLSNEFDKLNHTVKSEFEHFEKKKVEKLVYRKLEGITGSQNHIELRSS